MSRGPSRSLVLALAVAALTLAAPPAPTRAAGQIGSNQITVTAPGARAVITRHPFRLAIQTGAGRTALREVANTRPAPLLEPATLDPVPPGRDNARTPTLYAPLTFTVGRETLRQYDGGLFGGNLMSGSRSGVQYSARDVLAARKAGRGVRLVLSTSDPSGRHLAVLVAPLGRAAIRVSVRPDAAAGVALVSDSFSSGRDEGFFGFGGRHNALDQRGNVLSSFVEEQNTNDPSQGRPSLFPNGPTAAYYAQAQFLSSRPYGFLLDRAELSRFKLASDRGDAWNVSASAAGLDYVVAPGRPAQAIRTLTGLTGRQPVPPRWALGPMLDRLNRNIGENQAAYEGKLRDDLRDIRHYKLPLTAYRIEGWGDPKGDNDGLVLPSYTGRALLRHEIAELRRRRIHPLVYFRPWVKPDSEPARRGWVARQANGRPATTTGTAGQSFALVDYTNPAAARFWRHEVTKAFDLGADGFMQDFGEEILFDMRFADGETGVTMHNRYLNLAARATRQAIASYRARHPRRQLWFYTRAGYSGRRGGAAYEGGNFPGDETTDWGRSSGLASLTSDMLSRAVGGAYGFGTDIGGYFDYVSPPTTKELFVRWAEWAALSPVFRLQGSGRTGTHTPWSYGDAGVVRTYRGLSHLHSSAASLILRLWRRAATTGIPPTRPLWLAYPSDPRARAQDQEWLLGRDVLVAPVVVEGARSRAVYFPRGCWRAPRGGPRYRGRRTATVSAPLTRLPYFFRCGRRPFGGRARR